MLKSTFIAITLAMSMAASFAQSKQIFAHDPVAAAANGKYYVYTTGPGITAWESEDLLHWKRNPDVFETNPAWFNKAVPKFDGHLWAPDVFYRDSMYYMYYSVSSFGSNLSAIGVATNKTLDPENEAYAWKDHGAVIQSFPDRDLWNAIDPAIIIDKEGTPWMSFGSFWGGLKMVKLNNDLLSIAEPQEWHTIARRERSFELPDTQAGDGALEAPYILRKGDYFYLFVSFDLCCRGAESTYNVRVGRSEKATGPYYDKEGISMSLGGGTLIFEGDTENYYAVGHNSAYTFYGQDYMFSHGYDRKDHGRQKLIVHTIGWDNEGWPLLSEVKE